MHPLRKLREAGKPTPAQWGRVAGRKHRTQQPDPKVSRRNLTPPPQSRCDSNHHNSRIVEMLSASRPRGSRLH